MIRSTLDADEYRALQFFRQSEICWFIEKSNTIQPCLRYLQGGKDRVDLCLNGAGRGYYRNLQTCNRVHLCPICAAKISKKRRGQLAAACDEMAARGCHMVFITYTVRHAKSDLFAEVRRRVQNAHRQLHSNHQWVLIQNKFGWRGSIRAIETTLGESGWHFHIHEIGFLDKNLPVAQFEQVMSDRWAHMVDRVGGSQEYGIGLTVGRTDREVHKYISKWGLVPELTGAAFKTHKNGGIAPFQLADLVFKDLTAFSYAKEKFNEYAEGIEGAKQILAGKELREIIHDIPAGTEKQDWFFSAVASLTPDQWRIISTTGKRVQCLRAIEDGLLDRFLAKL